MKKLFYITILSLLLFGLYNCKKADIIDTSQITCSVYDNSHLKSNELQLIIDEYREKGLPGISVLIDGPEGEFIGTSGYADLENGVLFTPCHISKAASITKLMVGTLTMMLQEEGVLDIDDPISDYIDSDILERIKNTEGVTIRDCMSHTTGIYDLIKNSDFYLAVLNNPNKQWRQEELLKYAYDQDPVQINAPYTANYSNTNTVLVSMCIEEATGRDHGELLREKIIDPLGMTSTYYQGRETLPATVAQGYYDLHNNGTIVNVSNLITGSGNGYGGMFSNVLDLKVFIRSLLIDKSLISDATLLDMQNEYHLARDNFYTGAGIVKKFTEKSAFGIGHTGRDLAYSADLFYFPDKDIIMVFFVNYGTDGTTSLKSVFEAFENELVDKILE
jgi:D-alanyl-D-alanine carboxypeptidase